MPARAITKAEALDLHKIQSIAFIYSMDVEKTAKEIEEKEHPEENCIATFSDDGRMLAGMVLPEFEMHFDGNIVKMIGVGGVASLPEYRSGGAIRQCFDFAYPRMLERGAAFTALYPFSHAYYRKFGYELGQPITEYTVPLTALAKYRHTGWATMLEKGDVPDDVKRLHARTWAASNTAILRSDALWKRRADKDPYKDKIYRYVLGNESSTTAYVVVEAKKFGDDLHAVVTDLAFQDKDAFLSILGFLSRLSAQYAKAKLTLPGGIPIFSLVDDPYEISIAHVNKPMFRIVDVQKVFEAMRLPEDHSFSVRVKDELIRANDGTFFVTRESGKNRVTSAEGPVDFTADIRTLTQMCLGYLALDEALYIPDFEVFHNADALRRIFTRKECLLTEYF